MAHTAVSEAVDVLNRTQHRGARSWRYDEDCRRIMPEGWNGRDEAAPPCFTVFEARAIADHLARIGAASPARTSWLIAPTPADVVRESANEDECEEYGQAGKDGACVEGNVDEAGQSQHGPA